MLAGLMVMLWVGHVFWPHSDARLASSVVLTRGHAHYVLPIAGVDTLYFDYIDSEGLCVGLTTSPALEGRIYTATGFFVTSHGDLLTVADTLHLPDTLTHVPLIKMLGGERKRLSLTWRNLKSLQEEMEYYKRTHGVVDEGYHVVMAQMEENRARLAQTEHLIQVIDGVLEKRMPLQAVLVCRKEIVVSQGSRTLPCACMARSEADGVELWRLQGDTLPTGMGHVRVNPIMGYRLNCDEDILQMCAPWGYTGAPEAVACGVVMNISRGLLKQGVKTQNGAVRLPMGVWGAPVFNTWGQLKGMCVPGKEVTSAALMRLMLQYEGDGIKDVGARCKAWWQRDASSQEMHTVQVDYKQWERGDTLFSGFLMPHGGTGQVCIVYPRGAIYSGAYGSHGREGWGVLKQVSRGEYRGEWKADSLPRGILQHADSLYVGCFNRLLLPHGEGTLHTAFAHYEGHWKEGKKHDFGCLIAPSHIVQCGLWKKGIFRGEKMLYHSDRVYGIDISKYQHGRGHRVKPINWKALRITHLGHISKKKVSGKVDYPVSFIYIKSTEGVTVRNKFYAADHRDARKCGYPVGAYHFFTTKPGSEQAAFFLKHTALWRGDLPPMLDVELSPGRVKAMGGREAMFREMLVWLKVVGRRVGTIPVVYVGQDFVNTYLPHAPRELKDYPMWVARYGEYKPYVHLNYWQLSPDGRVRGIHGEVDIDVWNGTKAQFDEYKKKHAIK